MSKKFLSPIKLAQGASNPAVGSAGELFFNTTDVKVYAHNGTSWVPSGGGVTVSATAPSTPIAGDAWYDTVDGTLYVYYNDGDSSQWVEVAANSGVSVALSGRLGVVETYVTTLQSQMATAQSDIDIVETRATSLEGRATSLETRATSLELADSTTNKSGLVPIIPSSISSGGTASVSSSGVVSFTASGIVSLNGIFSSTYVEYLVVGRWVADADRGYGWRWRAAGVDKADAYYHHTQIWNGGSGVGSSNGQNATFHGYSLGHRFVSFEGTFTGGAQSGLVKTMAATYNGLNSATTQNELHIAGGIMRESGYIADGLTMFCSAGSMTGHLQVFGVRR